VWRWRVLAPVAPVNGQFALSIVGQPGYQYVVQASTNLVNWISIATNISPFNFVDSDMSRFQQRFIALISWACPQQIPSMMFQWSVCQLCPGRQ